MYGRIGASQGRTMAEFDGDRAGRGLNLLVGLILAELGDKRARKWVTRTQGNASLTAGGFRAMLRAMGRGVVHRFKKGRKHGRNV